MFNLRKFKGFLFSFIQLFYFIDSVKSFHFWSPKYYWHGSVLSSQQPKQILTRATHSTTTKNPFQPNPAKLSWLFTIHSFYERTWCHEQRHTFQFTCCSTHFLRCSKILKTKNWDTYPSLCLSKWRRRKRHLEAQVF